MVRKAIAATTAATAGRSQSGPAGHGRCRMPTASNASGTTDRSTPVASATAQISAASRRIMDRIWRGVAPMSCSAAISVRRWTVVAMSLLAMPSRR
jgi:hypothetical protein